MKNLEQQRIISTSIRLPEQDWQEFKAECAKAWTFPCREIHKFIVSQLKKRGVENEQ